MLESQKETQSTWKLVPSGAGVSGSCPMWVLGTRLRTFSARAVGSLRGSKVPTYTHLVTGNEVISSLMWWGDRVGAGWEAGCLAPFSYTKLFQLHFVCIVLSQILPRGCWALGWTFVGRKQGLLLISITAAMGPGCCCFLPVREADEEILGQGCWPPWPRIQLSFSLFFPVVDAHSDHIEKLMEAWLPGCLE